jgi:hypothetical protein
VTDDQLNVSKLMGRLDSGLVMSLLFIILGPWMLYFYFPMFNISTIICYSVVNLVGLLNIELEIPPLAVSMCLLLCWLLLIIYLLKKNPFPLHMVKHGLHLPWLRDIPLLQWRKPELRTGSRHSKSCCFRTRKLPFNMVVRCKDHPLKDNGVPRNIPLFVCRKTWTIKSCYTLRDQQHRCWRRRPHKSKYRAWKRRVLDHKRFLLQGKAVQSFGIACAL